MIARRSVWSKEDIKAQLKDFIPAADEVWYLHHGDNPEQKFFQGFCEEGHYGTKNGGSRESTRQGTYVCTPNGKFLGSVNTNDAARMAQLLRESLAKYKAMPKKERLFAEKPADLEKQRAQIDRAENKLPKDGMVLMVRSRDLPREQPIRQEEWAEKALNVDPAWLNKDEVNQFIPKQATKKFSWEIGKPLLTRLVRLSLVDNVRGQTDIYRADAVKEVSLKATVRETKKGVITIDLEGKWEQEQGSRGTKGLLRGELLYDTRKQAFTQFDLVAAGTRKGRTQYNFRERDDGEQPIGWVYRMTDGHPTDRIAPAAMWEYGWR